MPNKPIYNFINEELFLSLKCPYVIYFLGLVWADGHVSKKCNMVTVSLINYDFLTLVDVFNNLGQFKYGHKIINDGKTNMVTLNFSNKKIHQFLVDNDYSKKSGNSADKILSKIPEDLKYYWWRGYFDGDGSVGKLPRKNLSIGSTYEQDWTFAEKLFLELGINRFRIERKIRNSKSKYSVFRCSYELGCYKFGKFIYQGEKFGLGRKFERFHKLFAAYEEKINTKTAKLKKDIIPRTPYLNLKQNYKTGYKAVTIAGAGFRMRHQNKINSYDYYSENKDLAAQAYDSLLLFLYKSVPKNYLNFKESIIDNLLIKEINVKKRS